MENELKKLAVDLFSTFAHFEYALKAAGFHKGDGAAEANWRQFAESVTPLFDNPQDENFREAIDYILKGSRWRSDRRVVAIEALAAFLSAAAITSSSSAGNQTKSHLKIHRSCSSLSPTARAQHQGLR